MYTDFAEIFMADEREPELQVSQANMRITLCEKLHCEFGIAVSCETGSSSMLNKSANRAYKACADWLNHLYSQRESQGYKVESRIQNLL